MEKSLDSHYEYEYPEQLYSSFEQWIYILELLSQFGNSSVFIRLKYFLAPFFLNGHNQKANLSLRIPVFYVEIKIVLVQILLKIIS